MFVAKKLLYKSAEIDNTFPHSLVDGRVIIVQTINFSLEIEDFARAFKLQIFLEGPQARKLTCLFIGMDLETWVIQVFLYNPLLFSKIYMYTLSIVFQTVGYSSFASNKYQTVLPFKQ